MQNNNSDKDSLFTIVWNNERIRDTEKKLIIPNTEYGYYYTSSSKKLKQILKKPFNKKCLVILAYHIVFNQRMQHKYKLKGSLYSSHMLSPSYKLAGDNPLNFRKLSFLSGFLYNLRFGG